MTKRIRHSTRQTSESVASFQCILGDYLPKMNLHHISPDNYRRIYHKWLWIFLTTFVLMTIQTQCEGVTASCDIPSVFEKQSAMLTCSFGKDISTLLRNFKVVHYPSNGKPEVIALCHWSKGQAMCQTKSGYQHAGYNGSTFFLKILSADPSQAGGYKCHVQHSRLEKEEICNFTVTVPSTPSVSTDLTASAKPTTFLDGSGGNCGGSDLNPIIKNAVIFFGVTLILESLALLCALLYIIRLSATKDKEKKSVNKI